MTAYVWWPTRQAHLQVTKLRRNHQTILPGDVCLQSTRAHQPIGAMRSGGSPHLVDVRPLRQEELDGVESAPCASVVERRSIVKVEDIHVGAFLHEELDELLTILHGAGLDPIRVDLDFLWLLGLG